MFEYTTAYLSPFHWAKTVYDAQFNLKQPPNGKVDLNSANLTRPTLPILDKAVLEISTAQDWNLNSKTFLSTINALNKSYDQAQIYLDTIYNFFQSRIAESEERLNQLENNLKLVVNGNQRVASNSMSIAGADTTRIDFDPKFYTTLPPLQKVPEESCFKLRDGGFFSSIRSLGGFAGSIQVERALLDYRETGLLTNITDGSRNSFWAATAFAPAPVRSNSAQVPWLPESYQYGFALLLSYLIDRPTLVTELFIDPIVTEPVDLLAISWQPDNLPNIVTSLISATGWSTSGSTSYVSGGSVSASSLLVNINPSGFGLASYTFKIPTSSAGVSGSQVQLSNRAQLNFLMKGLGDLKGSIRVTWVNASGQVLDYTRKDFNPTNYWSGFGTLAFIPKTATSGILELGVLDVTTEMGSVWFDGPTVNIGDEVFNCNLTITGPTTVQLPKAVLSNRFSVTLSQRNTRREKDSKIGVTDSFEYIPKQDLNTSLQQLIQDTINKNSLDTSGETFFTYRIGLKELDLRYREHIPKGKLVTQPLRTKKEIRELWVTAELGRFYNTGLVFKVIPFAADLGKEFTIKPWLLSNNLFVNANQVGDVFRIFSTSEVKEGWADGNNLYLEAPEQGVTETFNGTNPDGRLVLSNAPHLRRTEVRRITSWLEDYSPWPAFIDPNTQLLYGFTDENLRNAIRSNQIPSGVALDSITTTQGYQPIKVTIATETWTAYPDIYGRPDASRVRQVTGEELTDISNLTETQNIQTSSDVISFDAWLATTLGRNLWNQLNGKFSSYGITSTTLRLRLENALTDNLAAVISQSGSLQSSYTNQLKVAYDKLRLENQLGTGSSTTTNVSVLPQRNIFSTKNSPILGGPQGSSSLRLFWFNPAATGGVLPIPRSDFEIIDAKQGRIRVLKNAPSGFTKVLADYLYINQSGTEDFFSNILTTVTSAASSASAFTSELDLRGRTFPITRNMTNYLTGIVPELRSPNFNRLSKDYYPVIEYYVTSDGELIFARSFHPFSEIPGRITVEYETLGVMPRISVEVRRSGSSSTTPTIRSFNLRVNEASSSPLGERNV